MKNRLTQFLASAGGGKTYELTDRYINIIKKYPGKEKNLKKILAITFTDKAAVEMKEKVLRKLKKIYHSHEKDENKRKEAEYLIDYIIDNYSDFSIRTIDSFINTIVKVFSLELGYPPETEITHEYEYFSKYAVARMIDRVEKDRSLKNLLIHFILKNIEVRGSVSWNFKNMIYRRMKKLDEYRLNKNLKLDSIEFMEEAEIFKMKNEIISVMEKIVNIEDEVPFHGGFLSYLNDRLEDENIDNMCKSKRLRKGVKAILKGKDKEKYIERVKPVYRKLQNLIGLYYAKRVFLEYNMNARVFKKYVQILRKVKKEERIRFVSDINREMEPILEKCEDDAFVPFLFYKIGGRFLYYLIDEFQDTSIKQWQSLLPLIKNSLSEGGELFYVGDPKQAIYQWRGGDVKLFNKVLNEFKSIEEDNIQQESSVINYRSGGRIIDFVNNTFSRIDMFKEKLGKYRNFYLKENFEQVPYKNNENRGFVRVTKLENKKVDTDEMVRKELLSTLNEVIEYGNYSDITILVREKKQGKIIVDWLVEEGIPVFSDESLYISSDSKIKGLISFLQFLQNPVDNNSFFGFIFNPVFLEVSGLSRNEVREWAESHKKNDIFYLKFRNDYPELWAEYIEQFFMKVGYLPAYDLINDIIRVYNIPENFPETNPFIEGFMEFAHNLEGNSVTSLELLLDEWERVNNSKAPPSILLPEGTEAVRVMTVHSAKGLEFPVVILPFTYFSQYNPDKNKVIVDYKGSKRVAKTDGLEKIPVGVPSNLKNKLQAKLQEKEQIDFFEEINILYVALTRAREQLYIFVPEEKALKRKFCYWIELLHDWVKDKEIYQDGERESIKEKRGKKISSKISIKTGEKEGVESVKSRLIFRKNDVSVISDEDRLKAVKLGNTVHRALFHLEGTRDEESIKKAVRTSVNERVNYKERDLFYKKALGIIKKITHNEKFNDWFKDEYRIWKEKEIVSSTGDLYRMDRVVIKDAIIDLIDYKTGDEEISNYREQMRKYRNVLTDYFPDKKINTFIVHLKESSIQEIDFE